MVTVAVSCPPAGTSGALRCDRGPGRQVVARVSGRAEERAVSMVAAGGVQGDRRATPDGVGDLDPAVDDGAWGEVVHDVQPRSRVVAGRDRDVEQPRPDAALPVGGG